MNTMRYALLVKDIDKQNKIALMQKIRNILFAVVFGAMVLFFVLFYVFESIVGSIVFLSTLAVKLLYNTIFFAVISKERKRQILDPSEEIDQTIFELNEKYKVLLKKKRTLVFIGIGIVLLAIAVFALYVLTNHNEQNIDIFSSIFAVVFVLSIVVLSVVDSILQQRFVKDVSSQLEILQARFFEIRGLSKEQIAAQKRNMFNASDAEKMLTYIYPDEKIRKSATKMVWYTMLPFIAVGAFIGVFMLDAVKKLAEEDNPIPLFILLGVFLISIVAMTVLMVYFQKRLRNRQKKIFDQDVEKYKYHLELMAESKATQKRSDIITGIFAGVVFVLCAVLSLIAKDGETIVGICVIGFFVMLFGIIAMSIVLTVKYRKKAKVIENLIDEHMKNYEVEQVDENEVEQVFDIDDEKEVN